LPKRAAGGAVAKAPVNEENQLEINRLFDLRAKRLDPDATPMEVAGPSGPGV
jgi:hypothetical protein